MKKKKNTQKLQKKLTKKRSDMKKLLKKIPKKNLEKIIEDRVFGSKKEKLYQVKNFPEKYFTIDELKKLSKNSKRKRILTKNRNNIDKKENNFTSSVKMIREQSFNQNINGKMINKHILQNDNIVKVKIIEDGNIINDETKNFKKIEKAIEYYDKKVDDF